MTTNAAARIHVGIGGWTYPPWRNNFYPPAWPQSRELEYAGARLGAIEINATYHGAQKPASFARWRDATPDGFKFSVKASRFATNRKRLAEAGESIARFIDGGIAQLGAKLGPIVWQFMPTKAFEPEDFEGFLRQLPRHVDGLPLRHALEVRHATFMTASYLRLARKYRCATVFADSAEHPSFADLSGDFVYARLMRSKASLANGYAAKALDDWARCAKAWAQGGEPAGLPRVRAGPACGAPRDVFIFFINGAKERAPAAALRLLKRLA